MGFKGTLGKYEIVEHTYEEISIGCNDKTIASLSVDEDSETYEEDIEVMYANARLLREASNMISLLTSMEAEEMIPEYFKNDYEKIKRRILQEDL